MKPISASQPTAYRIVVMAEFRQDDAQKLAEFAAKHVDAGGGGNLLIDVTSMSGFSFSAVTVELAHIPTFLKWIYGLDRIAFISDEDWIRSAARLESALLPGVVYEVYDDDEAEAARAWVLEQEQEPHKGAFHPIDIEEPGIAAFELAGRLDREESERGVAMVRAALEDPECSKMMLVIRSWHGFDADTLFSSEVLRVKLDLIGKLDRYAIVGGPGWVGTMASAIGTLMKPEIRGFELDEQDKAVRWLSEHR